MRTARISLVLALGIASVAVLCVYWRAVDSPFIFDDSFSVAGNPSIFKLWPLLGDASHPGPLNPPRDLPTSGRPLVNLSLAINYRLGRLNPAGYHVFNLTAHLLSALLLMAIVRRALRLDYFGGRFLRASGPLALVTGTLWALHPLQTETVVYVTQRTELMVGFFYLATLYASLRYWDAENSSTRRHIWLVLATVACMAGMSCKEVMVSAPLIVLLFERTFITGSFRRAWRNSWPLYVGLFLSWAVLACLNDAAPRAHSAGLHLGVPGYVWWFTQAKVLWLYLKLAVWPWPLSIHYQLPYLTTLGAAWPWLALAAIWGVSTLILLWRRNAIGFVGAWVLLVLSPTLVVPIVTEVAAERRMYLPLAALTALAVAGGYWLVQQLAAATASPDSEHKTSRRGPGALSATIALLLIAVSSAATFHRLAVFHDEPTLWKNTLESQPDDPLAHNNLGRALVDAGHVPEGVAHYRQALQINPDFPDALNNLGIVLANEGRLQEAIELYQHALRVQPEHAKAHNSLGVALSDSGRLSEAIEQFQLALRFSPAYAIAHYNLGNALTRAGSMREAVLHYQQAIQIDLQFTQAWLNLANACAQLQLSGEAIAAGQKALDLARSQANTALADKIEAWLVAYRLHVASPPPEPGSRAVNSR